jgi:hypothetical protein
MSPPYSENNSRNTSGYFASAFALSFAIERLPDSHQRLYVYFLANVLRVHRLRQSSIYVNGAYRPPAHDIFVSSLT